MTQKPKAFFVHLDLDQTFQALFYRLINNVIFKIKNKFSIKLKNSVPIFKKNIYNTKVSYVLTALIFVIFYYT